MNILGFASVGDGLSLGFFPVQVCLVLPVLRVRSAPVPRTAPTDQLAYLPCPQCTFEYGYYTKFIL